MLQLVAFACFRLFPLILRIILLYRHDHDPNYGINYLSIRFQFPWGSFETPETHARILEYTLIVVRLEHPNTHTRRQILFGCPPPALARAQRKLQRHAPCEELVADPISRIGDAVQRRVLVVDGLACQVEVLVADRHRLVRDGVCEADGLEEGVM